MFCASYMWLIVLSGYNSMIDLLRVRNAGMNIYNTDSYAEDFWDSNEANPRPDSAPGPSGECCLSDFPNQQQQCQRR